MPNDYYIVLGIDPGANLSQIKKAYRNAIKRYHPDMIGENTDSHKFIAAREAYEVLSDAEKRREYDAQRHPCDNRSSKEDIPKAATHRRPTRKSFRSSPIQDHFPQSTIPGFYRSRRQRPAHAKQLYLEVILTEEEALRGGVFPLTIPVETSCPHCGTNGWPEDSACPACLGLGVVRSRRSFDLSLPPELSDGTTFNVAFDAGGLGETTLFIAVRVMGNVYW
jgi:molecular chaperone DnaJ